MSGTPGENDWFEKEDGKKGQDPKGPTEIAGDTEDKNKGQEKADIVMEESKEKNKVENKGDDNEEPIVIEDGRKKVWICGICKTKVNKGSVKCMGCSKWIHRRYSDNKPNCSGLKRDEVYNGGKYRCQNCLNHTVKRKGPGRPVKPKYANKIIDTQRRQKRYTSVIPMNKRGKRKTMEEETSEKPMSTKKNEGKDSTTKTPIKSPSRKKPKADGDESEDLRDTAKNVNVREKCVISCGGANLNQADIESLEGKGLVTDEIILFFMQAILEYMKSQIGDKVSVVGPNVAYLIQKEFDKRVIESQKKEINQKEHDWVIYPINDKEDPEKGDGGSHWCLIVYNRSDNLFLYFDPIKGMNAKNAKALHLNIIDDNSYQSHDNAGRLCHYLPPLVEVNCQRQTNGYDCGIFIMMYMATIMKNIVNGRKVDDDKNIPYKADELRQLLLTALKLEIDRRNYTCDKRNIIDLMEELKKGKIEKEKEKADEEKRDKEKMEKEKEVFEKAIESLCNKDTIWGSWNNVNNKEGSVAKKKDNVRNNNDNNNGIDKRNGMMNEGSRPRKPCWYYMNDGCRNGKKCRFEHPDICIEWYEQGRCEGVNGDCEMIHPKICSKFAKREHCTYGSCLYMHPRGMKKANNSEGRKETQTQMRKENKTNRDRDDSNVRGYNRFFHQVRNRGRQILDRSAVELRRGLQQKIGILVEEEIAFLMQRKGNRARY